MKLKRLDIIGFKSFIDKASLTFPDGITAIVGPNGSGKSNLMDAIKWALGEQSAKSLRGKSMEDVIFNGSREKKPLGMAEVTLTFGSIDGNLPHNFSHFQEITVRRRIYRSGESEYFLNKTPCRLKDITDLFLGTGVGSKTYSMIAQGQIGDLVTARPIDRRTIIEEAAGITKYKAKKIESQRKMEATQANLVRIGDIVGEVKRQMDSLSLQAKKAEEYKQLKTEVKHLELVAAAREFLFLNTEIERMGAKIGEQEQEETAFSTRVSVLEGNIEQEKSAALEKEESYSEIQKRYYATETSIKTLEQQIEHLKERIALTNNQNNIFTEDIEGLSRLIDETKSRIEEAGRRITSCDEDAGTHQQELEIVETKIDSLQSVIDDLSGQWDSLREEQMAQASRIARLHNTIASSEKWIERSKNDIDKKTGERQSLTGELRNTDESITAAGEKLEKTRSEHEQAAHDLEGATADVERLVEEESRLTKEHRAIEADKTRALLKKTSIEEMEKNFEGLTEGTKQVMTGDREGVLGILVDFIESDERHEKALEGYLGEAVSAVVVKHPRDARRHIDRLKKSGKGRAVFIPVSALNNTSSRKASEKDGRMGLLTDHVTIKGPDADALFCLLSGAYLAENIERAIDIWESGRPEGAVVTLDGEVITRDGIIFGGSGREGEFSLLKNKREKKELADELVKTEASLTEKQDQLRTTSEALSARRKELKGLEGRLTELTIAMGEVKQSHAAQTRERERLIKAHEVITAEIQRESSEIDRLTTELEDSLVLLADAEKDENDLKTRTEGFKWNLTRRREEMRQIEDEQTEIRLSLNTARDTKRHLLSSQDEYNNQIARAQRDQEQKRASLEEAAREIEQHIRRIAETEQTLYQTIEESKRIEDLMHGARGELDTAVIKQRDLEEERKQLQKQLTTARDDVQISRDKMKEITWEKENLVTRIQERHQEDLGEIHARYTSETMTDEEIKARQETIKRKIDRFGEVNLMALSEYTTYTERYEFLKSQQADLETSLESLESTIKRIDRKSRERFMAAFEEINEKFKDVFVRLLPGGRARLTLTDEADPLESGVDILAQPPGKRLSSITLLSGGEKAVTAIAMIFAIFMVKPTPFCMMDEMDAPLDDINTERIIDLLKEISQFSQVILITHNKRTMEMADTLYGITMEEPGVSKTVSVKLTS